MKTNRQSVQQFLVPDHGSIQDLKEVVLNTLEHWYPMPGIYYLKRRFCTWIKVRIRHGVDKKDVDPTVYCCRLYKSGHTGGGEVFRLIEWQELAMTGRIQRARPEGFDY